MKTDNMNTTKAELPERQWLPIPQEGNHCSWIQFPMSEDDFDLLTETLELWRGRITKQKTTPPLVEIIEQHKANLAATHHP